MSVFSQHWHDLNEQRAYPFVEMTSRVSNTGDNLPDNILVDANIWIPEEAGNFVYVSSITISEKIVSITISACDENPFDCSSYTEGEGVLIGSLSVLKPVEIFRNYELNVQYPGAKGWVAFGSGARDTPNRSYRFSSPTQTMLVGKAARNYRSFPLDGVRKTGGSVLTGVVSLRSGNDIHIRSGTRTIGGVATDVILVGLDIRDSYDNLVNYLSVCDGRPESGTCGRNPIQTINSVSPDENGNLTIEFEQFGVSNGEISSPGTEVYVQEIDHRLILQFPWFGLSDVCPDRIVITRGEDETAGNPMISIDFEIPTDPDNDNLHFQIQFSPDQSFSVISEDYESNVDPGYWQIWSNGWVAFPAGGVGSELYGEKARIRSTDTTLSGDVVYWFRMRAWDGAEYSDWTTPQSYMLERQ